MAELATLLLDTGEEVRVEVVSLGREEIIVRRAINEQDAAAPDLLSVVDSHLASAKRHAAGSTDRLLAADRDRAY